MLAVLLLSALLSEPIAPSPLRDEPAIYSGQLKEAASLAFSPNGSWLATGGLEGEVVLWAADSCLGEHHLGKHDGAVHALAFSRDGRWLASGDHYKTVKLWDLGGDGEVLTPKESHSWKLDGAILALSFSKDGKHLVVGSQDNAALVFSLAPEDREAKPRSLPHEYEVTSVAISHDGKTLATGDGGGTVRTFSFDDLSARGTTKLAARVTGLAFSKDDATLFGSAAEAGVHALSVSDLAARKDFKVSSLEANALAVTPDGKSLVIATQDGKVRIVNATTGAPEKVLEGHEGPVIQVAIAPSGSPIVSASRDRTVRVVTFPR